MATRVNSALVNDDVLLDGSLDFMRLLWSVEHGTPSVSKRIANEIGITGVQPLVLRTVGDVRLFVAFEAVE